MVRVRSRSRGNRGAVLILVLGILALLAFIAAAFAALTSLEVKATANYRDGEHARYVAWSGIERAKFELRRAVVTPGYPMPWVTPDQFDYSHNASGDLPWLEFNYYTSSYIAQPPLTIAPDAIEHQKAPSFGLPLSPVPSNLKDSGAATDRRLPWPSGIMGASYYTDKDNPQFKGDYYTLRVTPANTQLYLNDSNPSLGTMLDTLANVLGLGATTTLNGFGAAIVAARPATGFARPSDLEGLSNVLKTYNLKPSDMQILEPYLTCASRVDPKVIARQSGGNPDLTLSPRAPIDINWAPYPVLVAVLNGITTKDATSTIKFGDATSLALAIMKYRCNPTIATDPTDSPASMTGGDSSTNPVTPAVRRYGFRRWPEFVKFLGDPSWTTLSFEQREAVAANCNPNTDLNKFVPDYSILRKYDKSDLTGSTTEFCFSPGGIFTIESYGVILGPDASVIAAARARSVVRIFEQYVETTQEDFEDDRVDPEGVLCGLRDISSLPESRNTLDAHLTGNSEYDTKQNGLYAATYDGQLTFNVITKAVCASDGEGTFAGFIDRTVNGKRSSETDTNTPGNVKLVEGGPPTVRPLDVKITNADGSTATKSGPGAILGPKASGNPLLNPDWFGGSDLHPLASFCGRAASTGGSTSSTQGRGFVFDQDQTTDNDHGVMKPVHHNVTGQVVTLTDNEQITLGGSVIATIQLHLSADLDDYFYDTCDTQSFELWFKPAANEKDSSQALLDWTSGEPVEVIQNKTDILTPGVTSVSSSSFQGGYNITFNAANRDDKVTIGAQAKLQVWLDKEGSGPSLAYQLHCRFIIDKTNQDHSNQDGTNIGNGLGNFKDAGSQFQSRYQRDWTYNDSSGTPKLIYPGTWHHFVFAYQKPDNPKQNPDGSYPPPDVHPTSSKSFTFFYADGVLQQSSEPDWPTEIDGNARLLKLTIQRLQEEVQAVIVQQLAAATSQYGNTVQGPTTIGSPSNFTDMSKYRVPVVIPIGDDTNPDIYFGMTKDNSIPSFLGLVDNIVVDSNYLRGQGAPTLQQVQAPDNYLPRYDCFRPSTDKDDGSTTSGLEPHTDPLIFRKRTQAVEWDRPIKIVSYETTAWKSAYQAGSDAYADLGHVFVRFGWWRPSTDTTGYQTFLNGIPKTPNGMSSTGGDYGWTARLDKAPYNCFSNGYLIPDRYYNPTPPAAPLSTGGFLTLASSERYYYAIEIRPTTDPQDGPRMAPVIDDVTVTYMPWDTAIVIEEEEVVD